MHRLTSQLRALLAAAALASGLVGPLPVASAQDAASPEASEPGLPPEPTAVATADIAVLGSEAREKAALIQSRAEVDARIEGIASTLEESSAAATALAEQTRKQLEPGISMPQLTDLETEWKGQVSNLARWRETVRDRVESLQLDLDGLDGLDEMKATWSKTRDAAAKEELPEEVLVSVGAVLASIEEASDAVRERRSAALGLQTEIAERAGNAGAILKQITDFQNDLRGQLLARDSVPLWEAVVALDDGPTFAQRIASVLADQYRIIADFKDKNGVVFAVHILIMAVLLGVILYLRHAVGAVSDDDEAVEASIQILDRPVSSALLVALLCSPFIHPQAPAAFDWFVLLLLVVPVLRLAPGMVSRRTRPAIYLLAVWYVISWLQVDLGRVQLLSRLILFAEGVLVSALLAWLLRPGPITRPAVPSRWLRATALGLRVALALMVTSVVANLLGNTSLAELLAVGTLSGAYSGILLFAGTRVMEGLWTLFLRSTVGRQLRVVRLHTGQLKRAGQAAIRLAAAALWTLHTLTAFSVRDEVTGGIRAVLEAEWSVGDLSFTLSDPLLFGFVVWLSLQISRFVRFILEEEAMPRATLPRGVPYAISWATHYTILLLGFLLAVAAAGFDLSRFALIVGALGVGIGIGLQDVVNNFVSGLILLFERPVQPGETVEVGSLLGQVKRIGIRTSTIRTWDGAEVIVPNSKLVSDQVVNWTLSDRQRRITLNVGVAYGTNPDQVLELLVDRAHTHEEIMDDPEPNALFVGFGDSSLDFELRMWTDHIDDYRRISSEVLVSIEHALGEAGIEIPFPQRDLHVRSIAPGVVSGE